MPSSRHHGAGAREPAGSRHDSFCQQAPRGHSCGVALCVSSLAQSAGRRGCCCRRPVRGNCRRPVHAGILRPSRRCHDSGASDPAARRAAFVAFGAIVALGLASMILRLIGLQAIVPFTLRIMSDVSRDAFMRVQRFSTDWHANSFAGSTVRKITRGMWALDLLNDTILMALLPSLLVLLGSMILLGLHWPSLGAVIAVGTVIYVSMTVAFSTQYIAPAARVSNAWDTRVGGTLADALTCNGVVKSFGAEAREDARLGGVIGRWRVRVRRTWLRYNYTSTAQLAVLLCFRGSVIGGAILLWIAGRATPGDVTYVLTSYYIIHAYLRDVGMHINNLQRSVNDMEELVAIHAEPIGIADRPGATPIDIQGGRILFDAVTFHYGGQLGPLPVCLSG